MVFLGHLAFSMISLRIRNVFLKQCVSWMLYGHLTGNHEFFISSNHHFTSNEDIDIRFVRRLSKLLVTQQDVTPYCNDISDFDWNESYTLKLDMVPLSLLSTKAAADMLFIGKAVKLCQIVGEEFLACDLYGQDNITNFDSDNRNNSNARRRMHDSEVKKGEIYNHFYTDGRMETTGWKPDLIRRKTDPEREVGISSKIFKRMESELCNILISAHEFGATLEHFLSVVSGELSSIVWTLLKGNSSLRHKLKFLRNTYLLGSGEFFHLLIDELLSYVHMENHANYVVFTKNVIRGVAESLNVHDKFLNSVVSVKKSDPAIFSSSKPISKCSFYTRGYCCIEDGYISFLKPNVESTISLSSMIRRLCFQFTLCLEKTASQKYLEGALIFSEEALVTKNFSGSLRYQCTSCITEDTFWYFSSNVLSSGGGLVKIGSLSAKFYLREIGTLKIGVEYVLLKRNSSCDNIPSDPYIRLFIHYTWPKCGISSGLDEEVDCMIPLLDKIPQINAPMILEFEHFRDKDLRSKMKVRVQSEREVHCTEDGAWDLSVPVEFPMEDAYRTVIEVIASGMMLETPSLSCNDHEVMKVQYCAWKLLDMKVEVMSFSISLMNTISKYHSTDILERIHEAHLRFQQCLNVDVTFEAPASLDILVDSKALKIYKRLFSALFKLKSISVALQKVWLLKFCEKDRLLHYTRHIMHYYIASIFFHYQANVVESFFIPCMQKIENQCDIQSAIQIHGSFLNSVVSMSMVDNVAIQESLHKLLNICSQFLAVCVVYNDDFKYISSECEIRFIFREFSVAVTQFINLLKKGSHNSTSVTMNSDSGYLCRLVKKLNEIS